MLRRAFALIVRLRWLFVVLHVGLALPFGYFASKVRQDNSIERLIVQSDPALTRTRDFQKVFGAGELAIVGLESDDPFSPAFLARFERVERELAAIGNVEVSTALGIFRRAKAGYGNTPEEAAAFRAFATKTQLFRRQGLVGDDFLTLTLVLRVEGVDGRRATLDAIEKALAPEEVAGGPVRAVRRLGQPFLSAYLDETTQSNANRMGALFVVFVVVVTLGLFRSLRTLVAFLVTMGVCLALSVGYIGLTGGSLSIVSPMVPMTILVTVLATLVYLQSRFVERPAERSVDEHQLFSLENKLLACTASIFATAVGFAALAVSPIRPIREMGIWVAVGLGLSWVVIFTLFPALQRILRTPTSTAERRAGWFERYVAGLPAWSYRFRWALVLVSLAASAGGAVALFGLRGVATPMELLTNALEYIPRTSRPYQDFQALGTRLPGVSISNVWLQGKTPKASLSEPEVLAGLHAFSTALEADPDVGAAIGPTTILRLGRHAAGLGDGWPDDKAALEELAGELESLSMVKLPDGRGVLDAFAQRGLAHGQIAVVSRARELPEFERVDRKIRDAWAQAVERHAALSAFDLDVVGLAPLQAKMSQGLVPTLVESFVLTVAIIFVTFLLVFRSGAARLMAMVPSLFAILAMFGVMRLTGTPLSITTILIASTVLGTSENDQIHFFYHFQEKRRDASVEASLRHAMTIAGRAILFATLINAAGFLAFALADLPPMRQFGLLTALAFALAMLADFTALPAALWLVFRARPDDERR